MNRKEALEKLAHERHLVAAGQETQVGPFRAADAPGLARLFHAVCGDGYPIDTFYIPQRLIEENDCGALRSTVARTPCGDIVSHIALYRSSPPNPALYEFGLGLTLPAYRSQGIFARTAQGLEETMRAPDIDGIFGEAVCNHVTTQKLCLRMQMRETAFEPELMPRGAYASEPGADGRLSCLVYARVVRDVRRPLFVPAPYRAALDFLTDGLALERDFAAPERPRAEGQAQVEVKRFASAGVARCTLARAGAALGAAMAAIEGELYGLCGLGESGETGYALIQFFVDLGRSDCGEVVEQLRGQGYSLGGLLPIWFGSDALLMQKHLIAPDFDAPKLHTERGRALCDLVRDDRQENA